MKPTDKIAIRTAKGNHVGHVCWDFAHRSDQNRASAHCGFRPSANWKGWDIAIVTVKEFLEGDFRVCLECRAKVEALLA